MSVMSLQGLGEKRMNPGDPKAAYVYSNNVGVLMQMVMLPLMQV